MESTEADRNSVFKTAKSAGYRYPALTVAIVSVVVPVIAGLMIGDTLEDYYRRPYYSGIGLTLALLVTLLVWMFRETLSPSMRATWIQIRRIDPMWLLVLVAIVMRHALLQFVPPDFAAFEEVQQGKVAYDIVGLGENLTFHFLFTNALAAIGFVLFGQNLEGLRTAFEIANSIAILLVAIGLRRLNVGWTGTLATVFIMATTRWAVVTAGHAEEAFGPTILVALLIVSMIYSDTSRKNGGFWASIAGLASGLLLYGYTPFVFLTILAVSFWVFRSWFSETRTERIRSVQNSIWYVATFALISAPLISQSIFDPRETHFVGGIFHNDIPVRIFGDDWFVHSKQWFSDTLSYLGVILGAETQRGVTLFRANHEAMIPMIVGIAFVAGILNALLRPRSLLIFYLAVTVLVFSILIAVPSNRFFVGRLTPLLPILVICAGIMFDHLVRVGPENLWHRLPTAKALVMIYVVIVVGVNVMDVLSMSDNESTLSEYINSNYVVCKTIGEQPYKFEKVVTVSNVRCHFSDEIWLYRDTDFEAENPDNLPAPNEIEPSTLVVVGRTHGMSNDEIANVTELANATGNADTLLKFKTMLDRVGTVTFCHQCQRLTDR